MRGQNTLYNDLLPSSLDNLTAERGKRITYTDQRDTALAHRYYYHAHLIRRRYDDCLHHLHLEFHISIDAIVDRLHDRYDLIKELVAANTTPADLKKAYEHYNWTI